jgi:hypothetical protein
MKRALTLTSLLLLAAACASNDGFVKNDVNDCAAGSEVTIDAGWDAQAGSSLERGDDRLTMLVEVSNNSNKEITIKSINVDPMMQMNDDAPYELDRGSRTFGKAIAEGEQSTFEIPMVSRRKMQDRSRGVRASAVDVAVTVVLETDQSYRCRFRVPLGF